MKSDECAKSEYDRIVELLIANGVKEKKVRLLEPVIENVSWMRVKLDEARDAVKNSQVAIAYDNGGGQKGIRENPVYKGYENLWKSYMQGVKQIMDAIPEDKSEIRAVEIERSRTPLDIIRQKNDERQSRTEN